MTKYGIKAFRIVYVISIKMFLKSCILKEILAEIKKQIVEKQWKKRN